MSLRQTLELGSTIECSASETRGSDDSRIDEVRRLLAEHFL